MRQNRNDYSYVLAIFLGNFGLGLLHTAFNFYYVKPSILVNEYWFNLAQILFLIWNAINDPLFGYLQDVSGTWMQNRSRIFTYFGPFFVISFLITWFPWHHSNSPPYVEGLHLIVSLFFYDAFFSCIGVAWSALYSDTTRDHRKRFISGIKYAQLASLCSVNVITITEKVSHSLENFEAFQFVCIVLSLISLVCLFMTGRMTNLNNTADLSEILISEKTEHTDNNTDYTSNDLNWFEIYALTKHLNLRKFYYRRIFNTLSTAHMNFAAIATDILIPQTILPKGSLQLSAFFAACTLLPQILIIGNDKLLLRNGAYKVYFYGIIASVISASLYMFSSSAYVVILFMLIDSITVHATSPLFNILLSEVIEDDKTRNSRRNPMSSLIFSLNALITKPAISIAPVIIVYLLNRNGYVLYQKEQIRTEELRLCMERIIFATPLLLGSLEFWIFRHYSLRHKHNMTFYHSLISFYLYSKETCLQNVNKIL
ncbi:hypothetical protein Mgra_00010056 [Meloidogyne graminicola]|uniref:Uncharacterized protein n=1 Tax=Meloidogyne graminicola TaxID=189291 RepID=A0A8S9Z8J8_9BILA|nr:hypothetical protein Mgra_00010056 [Meloidogyne graminicola]